MSFCFLLGARELVLDTALLLNFQERLLRRLRQEIDVAWARQYIDGCAVVTEAIWRLVFPDFPMLRVP